MSIKIAGELVSLAIRETEEKFAAKLAAADDAVEMLEALERSYGYGWPGRECDKIKEIVKRYREEANG